MKKFKYIIGIDEVGRGPLAGPVVVAAVILRKSDLPKLTINVRRSDFQILKDSKKLTPRQQENWFQYIKNHPKIFYAVASASPKIIDKINVSNAANLAAAKALNKLIANYKIANCKIFLDGGLYLNKSKIKNKKLKTPRTNCSAILRGRQIKNAKTVIKGDEKIPAIALASIVAKVSRDRLMLRLHKKYPRYGFDKHKGYGTKKHIKAIKKHGLSQIHRKSFKVKRLT